MVFFIAITIAGVSVYAFTASQRATNQNTQATDQSTNSTLGLQLTLSLNSTKIQSGEKVNFTSTLRNTLSTVNNVSGADNWKLPESELLDGFSCPSSFDIQLFQGHYTISNISMAGAPLQTDTPAFPGPECPLMQFAYYLFPPLGNIAWPPNQYYPPGTVISPCVPGPPTPFPPGEYTLAADDEWGQIAIVHFTVASPTLPILS
ncbi:MAG: hypothetical protein ABSA33_06160 [Candidatus Micrarchaeaceae archaeon]